MKKKDENKIIEVRFLSITDFAKYVGLGLNSARTLASTSGAVVRYGRRVLIDRLSFDAWTMSADGAKFLRGEG